MRDCKQTEERIIDALYGELSESEQRQMEQHLDQCASCRQAYADMAATLNRMGQRTHKDPGPQFWDGYWDKLEEKLNREVNPKSTILKWNGWAARTLAAAAILVIGIWLGRSTQHNNTPSPATTHGLSAEQVELAAYNQRTADYLQRSKVLILGLINFENGSDDPFTLNTPKQRQISEDLLKMAADIKKEDNGQTHTRLNKLIADLEIILMQIANLEAEHDMDAIEMVKSGVDRKGILLKINLEEMKQAKTSPKSENLPPHAAI